MRLLLALKLILFLNFSNAQIAINGIIQDSKINIQGSANTVKVIQGNNVTVFNLAEKEDQNKFLNLIYSQNSVKKQNDIILKKTDKVLEILIAIAKQNLLTAQEIANKFSEILDENNKLRNELESYKKSTNFLFKDIIDSAQAKLDNLDNNGFQLVVQNYILQLKKSIDLRNIEISKALSALAHNNYLNYKYTEALTQINEALAIENTFEFYYLQGKIYFKLFRLEESIASFTNSLKYALNDSLLALVYNGIGLCYSEIEKNEKSIELFENAYKTYHTDSFKYDNFIITILSNLVLAYTNKGDFSNAMKWHKKSIPLKENSNANIELETLAISYSNDGFLYSSIGDIDSSTLFYEKGINVTNKMNSSINPIKAILLNNIGYNYDRLEQHDNAFLYYKNAYDILLKIYGKHHPKSALLLTNLGMSYVYKGELELALNHFNEAYSIQKDMLGENHSETATTLNNIGLVYHLKKDFKKALDKYTSALSAFENNTTKTNTSLHSLYENIGLVYNSLNLYNEALLYFLRSKDLKTNMRIGNEKNLIQIKRYIALTYENLKDYRSAKMTTREINNGFKIENEIFYILFVDELNLEYLSNSKFNLLLELKNRKIDPCLFALWIYNTAVLSNESGFKNICKNRLHFLLNFFKDSHCNKTAEVLNSAHKLLINIYCDEGNKTKAKFYIKLLEKRDKTFKAFDCSIF